MIPIAVSLDEALLHAINGAIGNPLIDGLMITLGIIGRGYYWLLFSLPFLYKRKYYHFWGFMLALGVMNITVLCLKLGIARPRPTTTQILLMHDHMPAFPSGHAASAFACATFLAFAWKHWWVGVTILIYAGMIALSRVYVGVHYPTDVLVGSALGVGIGYLLYRISEKRAEVEAGNIQFFGFFIPLTSRSGSTKGNECDE